MRKIRFIQILPYLVPIFIGLTMMYLSEFLPESNFQTIMLSFSSTLLAIPLIFLFYEVIKNISERKLNKSIYDYAKWKVDRELMGILMQLTKRIVDLESDNQKDRILSSYEKFSYFIQKLEDRNFLGFQILKNFKVDKNELKKLLENPFILNKLGNKEIISIINIVKNLDSFSNLLIKKDLFVKKSKKTSLYKIIHGKHINPKYEESFPERYLVLKKINEENGQVFDFGDYDFEEVDNLLNYHTINKKYLEEYSKQIFVLIRSIKDWGVSTGNKFIIDSDKFRMANGKKSK